MLIKGQKRLGIYLFPLVVLLFVVIRFYTRDSSGISSHVQEWVGSVFPGEKEDKGHHTATSDQPEYQQDEAPEIPPTESPLSHQEVESSDIFDNHRRLYSLTTSDRSYFLIKFGSHQAINPNIIPHPSLKDTWVIVAQQWKAASATTNKQSVWFSELVCNAVFENDSLTCLEAPMNLPIAGTLGDNCEGALDYISLNVGPHDARVFYGPKRPYVVYGSNSMFTCFGQWMQDFRPLVDWGFVQLAEDKFRRATELQRPLPYQAIEKNWFIFWDKNEQMYAHYDIAPTRVFAKLEYDGSVGPDLAPLAALSDTSCMTKYMPTIADELESIHQATNSLSITLCNRSDPSCEPNDSNTFIFTIFQHKNFYSFHSVYEPYVMLFRREAPFEIHSISRRSFWINGRQILEKSPTMSESGAHQITTPSSEMFYITSMNWKNKGQKYSGYLDDVLFVAFGIEDTKTGGIDVFASDLFKDLSLCSSI